MKLRKGLIQLGILGLALVVGAAMPLVAQDTTVPKIVLVDGERVTTETAVGKQVRDRIQAAVADWESRITQSQGQLQAMLQNRQTQQLTLSSAALSQLDQSIEERQVELQRMQDDARRAIERMQAQGTDEVNKVLIPALEQLAAEQGYELVFDTRLTQTGGVLFYSTRLDVTDAFIAKVDELASAQ